MGKEIIFDYSKTAGFISEEEMKNMKSIVMSPAGNREDSGWISHSSGT